MIISSTQPVNINLLSGPVVTCCTEPAAVANLQPFPTESDGTDAMSSHAGHLGMYDCLP